MLEHVKCAQFEGTREYSHRITSISASTQYIHRSRCKKAVSRLACTVRAKCDLIAFVLCMWATQAEAISMSPSLCPCMLQGSHVCTLTAAYTCLPAPMLVSALTRVSATIHTSPLKWVCARKGLHCVCTYVIISGIAALPLDVTVQVIESYFKCSVGEHHITNMVPTV